MSNALAIAAVTAVLRDLLNNGLIDRQASVLIGSAVKVEARPPGRIDVESNESAMLNLFLYHVSPNAALRNVGLPTLDQRGDRVANTPLALDLYYLLSAYGKNDLDAEILLGYGMQILHEVPVLGRQAVRDALNPTSPVEGGLLPDDWSKLSASDLAEQAEMIKITPQPLNTEETSKLWAAFGAKYRPSVAYQVSVVLIESRKTATSAPPVLTRGPVDPKTGREEGVKVQADTPPPYPTLQELITPTGWPAVSPDDALRLSGHHLGGDEVAALIRHMRSPEQFELPSSAAGEATGFEVQLPSDPDSLEVGVYTAAAVIRQSGKPERITNALPFALAPRITIRKKVSGDQVALTVSCSPKVLRRQPVVLIVGEQEIAPEPFGAEKTDKLIFKLSKKGFPAGLLPVRLRVDGIESILTNRAEEPPVFYKDQMVEI